MADIDLPVFPFSPNWADGIIESLEWRTDVLGSYLGFEQRRSIRLTPRRFFEATFNPIDQARTFMDLWFSAFAEREFLLPLWHDKAALAANVAIGGNRLDFDNTFREFLTGGLALLYRGVFDYEVVEISAQDDTGLDLVTPTAKAWAAGSVLYPLRPSYLEDPQGAIDNISTRVGQTQIMFRLSRDNPYVGGPEVLEVFDGYPVVTLEPNRAEDMNIRYDRLYDDVDNETGRIFRRDEAARAFTTQFYNWQAVGRQRHHELRQTLYRLNGRQKAVWMPTFQDDVVLARDLVNGSNRLDIAEIGYRYLGGPKPGRDYILLKDSTGQNQIVNIIDTSIPLAAGEDRLDLAANVAFDADTGTKGSFVTLVRMEQDRVEITHHTDSEGVCEATAAFKSFARGRTTAGTILDPIPAAVMDQNACGVPASGEESPCLQVFVFEGWYARARVELINPTTGLPSSYVDPSVGPRIFSGIDTYYGNGVPEFIRDPDNYGGTWYWIDPLVLNSTEVDLRLQFPSGSVGEFMRARFGFQKWNEPATGWIVSGGGGLSPKASSTVISPGSTSWSLGNPFDVRGLWPDNWYFDV